MTSDYPKTWTLLPNLLGLTTILIALAAQIQAANESVEEIKRLLIRGRQEVQQDQPDRAIRTFSAALALKPDASTAAELHGQRGGAYVDKRALTEAMADAETAVRLAPEYFRGYQVRGRVYRLRKQFDRALYELNTALRFAPNFAQLYNNRGNLFEDKGQSQRAIQDFSEAIRRAPGSIDGYVNRGGSYTTLREFDKAIADLNRALQINPHDSDAYFNRAMAYEGKRNHHLALADFSKANELSPRDPECLNWIAWLKATSPHDVLRNGKEALTASLEACQLSNFKDAEHVDTLAAAYAENGDFDHAIEHLTKALRMKINSNDRKDFEKRLALYRDRKPYRETESARNSRIRRQVVGSSFGGGNR